MTSSSSETIMDPEDFLYARLLKLCGDLTEKTAAVVAEAQKFSDLLNRARSAEREQCARLVESWDPGAGFLGQAVRLNVAAAIRARGNP